jgi:hypothetical protein
MDLLQLKVAIEQRPALVALCTKTKVRTKDFPRKDAKTQSAVAFLRGFLCVFASLRLCVGNILSFSGSLTGCITFVQSPLVAIFEGINDLIELR